MFFVSSTTRIVAMNGSAPWQLEREAAAGSGRAVEEDAAAVRLHDVAHDREAEAGGADLTAVRALREALEDALLLRGRDAGAGVADGDADGAVGRLDVDRDPP